MSPYSRPPRGGQIGTDGDESRGIAEGGSAGESAQQATAVGRREPAAGSELPAGQAVVEALSRTGTFEFEASQCRVHLESCLCAEVSAAGAGSGTEKVRRAGGRAFRADAGGRALGRRRWACGECRDAAALDAGSRTVESATEAAEAPATARAQRTFRRAGADGWQLSSVAGGARTGGLLDRHGRRCDQHDLGAIGGTRDHLGGGGCAARVDRAVRRPLGAVRGLEELVQAAGEFAGAFTRGRTEHAAWAHEREAGDRADRSEFAGSQGTNRADPRHASRPAGEETAEEADPQSRSCELVPAEGISAGTQPAVRPCGGEAGRLPSAGTAGCGTGSDFPAGERADHRERLGSTLRESLFSAGAAEPPLCPGAEQGAGLRRAARRHPHRVSRSCSWLEGNCGAAEATAQGGSGGRTRGGSHCETEVGASGEPPLAREMARAPLAWPCASP